MNWATLALWAALALSGLSTGALAARWNSSGTGIPPRIEGLLLAASAAAVVAWFAHAGALLTNSASSPLLAAYVPVDVPAGFRLAVLWSTLPGAAMTLGGAALIGAVLLPVSGAPRARFVSALSGVALVALSVAAWFVPGSEANAALLPPFLHSPSAAAASLCALISLIAIIVFISGAVANQAIRGWALAAWTAATASVAAEQIARTQLGIGPRDAIVLGGASSGLILWLLASALMHRRVQALLRLPVAAPGNRQAVAASHAGALLLALSFGLHALAARSTVALAPGQTVNLSDSFGRQWQLANQGVSRFDAGGADITAVAIETRAPSGNVALLTPELRDHHRIDGQHLDNVVSFRRSAGQGLMALRLLLVDTDSLDVARVRVTFQPVPFLWLVGVVLLLASAAMVATPSGTPRSSAE